MCWFLFWLRLGHAPHSHRTYIIHTGPLTSHSEENVTLSLSACVTASCVQYLHVSFFFFAKSYLHLRVNPVDEDGHISINTRPVSESAALTPASVSNQPPEQILRSDQRTPAVPLKKKQKKQGSNIMLKTFFLIRVCYVTDAYLARVHSTLQLAGADHGVGDYAVINLPAVAHLRAYQGDLSLT